MANSKKRYALVGTGARAGMFVRAVAEAYPDVCELVAFCDLSQTRMDWYNKQLQSHGREAVPTYLADQFDQMVAETRPDTVIVTTMDVVHHVYICRAMELGCDVITEKPMTIDVEKTRAIFDTIERTGRQLRVSFNYRYSPAYTKLREVVMNGTIGRPLNVDFSWLLNTSHGADYFRRWHREKQNSGGLMVHKATHHFDLVNWWISSVPDTVFAGGSRRYYVPGTADMLKLDGRAGRCHTCPDAEKCPFRLNLENSPSLKGLYLDHEGYDGYFRDMCVFSEDIDIEDSMSVFAEYRNRVKLNYSLTAFSPWEGYVINFTGTEGRIEHRMEETVYINADGTVPGALKKDKTMIKVYPLRDAPYDVNIWEAEGGHGGADPLMIKYLFDPSGQPEDKYQRASDHRAGAWSIITGIAANHSIISKHPVRIDDLIPDMELPEFI